jgi:hypothetical protein
MFNSCTRVRKDGWSGEGSAAFWTCVRQIIDYGIPEIFIPGERINITIREIESGQNELIIDIVLKGSFFFFYHQITWQWESVVSHLATSVYVY